MWKCEENMNLHKEPQSNNEFMHHSMFFLYLENEKWKDNVTTMMKLLRIYEFINSVVGAVIKDNQENIKVGQSTLLIARMILDAPYVTNRYKECSTCPINRTNVENHRSEILERNQRIGFTKILWWKNCMMPISRRLRRLYPIIQLFLLRRWWMRTGVGERMCKKTDNKWNERFERPIIKYIYVELVLS